MATWPDATERLYESNSSLTFLLLNTLTRWKERESGGQNSVINDEILSSVLEIVWRGIHPLLILVGRVRMSSAGGKVKSPNEWWTRRQNSMEIWRLLGEHTVIFSFIDYFYVYMDRAAPLIPEEGLSVLKHKFRAVRTEHLLEAMVWRWCCDACEEHGVTR